MHMVRTLQIMFPTPFLFLLLFYRKQAKKTIPPLNKQPNKQPAKSGLFREMLNREAATRLF